ncbi:hypothetical protein [Sorangium sp. So ce341]|uniref:hypothetical protein n=1 Tax=Sorangium sp. So ce341 TaxID=3133302 RepID=UPI003F60CBB2
MTTLAGLAGEIERRLYAAATTACDGASFGDSEYLQPLHVLLRSLVEDIPAASPARGDIEKMLLRLLISRRYCIRSVEPILTPSRPGT